jgi:hypothetical protein
MRIRPHLACITLAVLALGAEGTAGAQSASPGAGSAKGSTKKIDTGASLDLSKLLNRAAAEDKAVASGLALPSGAGAPMQSTAGAANLRTLHGDVTSETSPTAGRADRVVPVGDVPAGGASVPARHAEAVIRGQINPAARSCYENDPSSKGKQAARLVLFIKLTPAGEVDAVDVAINIGVSPSVADCIATAAHAAKFAATAASGATVRASFAFPFPRQDDRPAPAAEGAKGAPTTTAPRHGEHDAVAKVDTQPTNGQTAHR